MKTNDTKLEIEFSDSERLNLHQLQIRRALALESKKKTSLETDEKFSSTDKILAENSQWKLVSENTKLHDWQEKCLDHWLPKGRGTIKVATGGGKTLFALAAAQKLQNTLVSDLRMVIVVPTIPLMNQWFDELGNSNLHPTQIGLLGGGNQFVKSENHKIIIAVINSAREKLPDIIKSLKWGKKLLLVVDECHRSNAKKSQEIFKIKPAFTLGLSATPEVNNVEEMELDETESSEEKIESELLDDSEYSNSVVGKALGEIIFDFSLKDCLNAGLLTKFDVCHVGLTLNKSEYENYSKISREISELHQGLQIRYRKSNSKQKFIEWCQTLAKKQGEEDAASFMGLSNERKRLLYGASNRTAFTLLILKAAANESKTQKNDSKVIVFHETISDTNTIYIKAEKDKLPVVLEHSKLPSSIRTESIELFRRGVTKIIVSVKSLVEGFNVPSADIGIIAASSSSVRQRIQSLGRMLRINESSSKATIFVLYIKGTEDEAIYENADWEEVLGAERNRYFCWPDSNKENFSPQNIKEVINLLEENSEPPRQYRPSCHKVDTSKLSIGDGYPGQIKGLSVRVDDAYNLKLDDGTLINASMAIVEILIKKNHSKRAKITPCGHLICRDDSTKDAKDNWIYIGKVEIPTQTDENTKVKFKIKQSDGKKVLVKVIGRDEYHARGIKKAESEAAGRTLERILQWLKEIESNLRFKAREIYWDGKSVYWIEYKGEKYVCNGANCELEFPK